MTKEQSDAELLEKLAKSMETLGKGWGHVFINSNDFQGLASRLRAIATRLSPSVEDVIEAWKTTHYSSTSLLQVVYRGGNWYLEDFDRVEATAPTLTELLAKFRSEDG